MNYHVNFWGSHPSLDNDDCWTGADYESKTEALKVYNLPASQFCETMSLCDAEYIEIDGPDIYMVRRKFVAPAVTDDDWRAEIAREEGMLGGIDAYNDHMGF